MDKKLIQQYGEDILCYRLRSVRQKKRMRYEDFDKQLIQLHKEEKKLYKTRWNLGWEPLTPPMQKGWKRTFVMREDVAKSKQAAFFEGILKKINTVDWHYRKDFKIKKRKFGRKLYVVKAQYLLRPYEWQFKKFCFTELEQQQFYETWELDWKKQPIKRFVFKEQWRFVLKTMPNIIDKRRIRDNVLEARLHEIGSYLAKNGGRYRQSKILGKTYRNRFDKAEKHDEINMYKNKSLQQILDAAIVL